jgi:hypothetical protein
LRRSRFNLPAASSSYPAGFATTAPRSCIWAPVSPSVRANVDEYWTAPPTGIV